MPNSVTFTKEGSKDLSPSTLPFPALRLFRSGDDRNAREANFHPKHRSKRTEFEEFQSNMISNKSRCEMKNNILLRPETRIFKTNIRINEIKNY